MSNLDQTDSPQKSLTNRAMAAGAYAAVVGIVLGLVFYLAGLNEALMTNTALKWGNNLLLFGISFYFIYTATKQHRDVDLGGFLSTGQGIGLGTVAGLVSGVISAVWVVIFMGYIAPEMMDQIKEIAMKQMQDSGQSEEQIEKAMEFSAFFFSPTFFAIVMVIFNTFFGFLAGLVSGLMLKKEAV